jgi:hypothetical protein
LNSDSLVVQPVAARPYGPPQPVTGTVGSIICSIVLEPSLTNVSASGQLGTVRAFGPSLYQVLL